MNFILTMESKNIKDLTIDQLNEIIENKDLIGLWNENEVEFGEDNPFPFQPYGPYVMVRFTRRDKTKGGIIIPVGSEVYVPWVQIVQVGTTCNLDSQIGDVVLIKKGLEDTIYNESQVAKMFEIAGVTYGIIREGSLIGRVTNTELLKQVYMDEKGNRDKNYEGKVLDGTKITKGE